MPLSMPDSIRVNDLPKGFKAYLGYEDGNWPTISQLRQAFPGAFTVNLTVTARTLNTDGIDCEPGNPNALTSANWIQDKLQAHPDSRPIAYADLASTGYRAIDIWDYLTRKGIKRNQYRILTAHYTYTAHICGPHTCGQFPVDADGTQWTNKYPGQNGSLVDMSMLSDTFFIPTQPAGEVDVKLPTLVQGNTGQSVRNWQGLLVAHGYGYLLGGSATGNVMQQAGVDGDFGVRTAHATLMFKTARKLPGNSTVDTATWEAGLQS